MPKRCSHCRAQLSPGMIQSRRRLAFEYAGSYAPRSSWQLFEAQPLSAHQQLNGSTAQFPDNDIFARQTESLVLLGNLEVTVLPEDSPILLHPARLHPTQCFFESPRHSPVHISLLRWRNTKTLIERRQKVFLQKGIGCLQIVYPGQAQFFDQVVLK